MPMPEQFPASEAEAPPSLLLRLRSTASACVRLLVLVVLAVAVLPVVRRFGKVSGADAASSSSDSLLGAAILVTALASAACLAALIIAGMVFLALDTAASWAGALAVVLAVLWYLDFPGDLLLSGLGRVVLAWKRRHPVADAACSCPQA